MEQGPANEARLAELTANLRESKAVAVSGLRRLVAAEEEVAEYLEENNAFSETADDTFRGLFAEWNKTPDPDSLKSMIDILINK